MSACAEHEATLTLALERVKRLEEALRWIERTCADEHTKFANHELLRVRIQAAAGEALRPEGT